MILTCAEMKALESRAFGDGISAETLMDEAGEKIALAVRQFFPEPGTCLVYFGKGHNGGDALVAARHLAAHGWSIELRAPFPEGSLSALTKEHFAALAGIPPVDPGKRPLVILDGLLGIGAGGPLREPIRSATREINRLRSEQNAVTFAIDLPTGLDADTGTPDPDAVVADYTLTIGCAKTGLLADAATRLVGRLAVLPLGELTRRFAELPTSLVSTAADLAPILPRRSFDTHKGQCGRVGILAGSPGLTGAAVMAAEACVHAGAGLVTLYCSRETQPLVVSRIAPEIMIRPVDSYLEILNAQHDALAIGPGLGGSRHDEIIHLIQRAPQPMVVDADALNALAPHLGILASCAGPRLLTPHPGEMARLVPASPTLPRSEIVRQFTERFPATLLLKGARTLIGERGQALAYNTTGTPGMATGGMGDVLTGLLAALLGQRLTPYDAARVGAWLCGHAAEIAISAGESEESLSATHVIRRLGATFRDLRARVF